MAAEVTGESGSAGRWGPLWGSRAADWARSEEQQVPTYEAALERVALEPGQSVLDIGCGAGVFLRLVADRGARAFGLDASEALIAAARERVPEADLRVGDMESLPYDDNSSDLVTGFNSFFFANDMVAALAEAGRVAKPGAAVVIQVWGSHEHNDLETMKAIARPFFPPRPADAPPEPDLSLPGALEELAARAGLHPELAFDTSWALEFTDEDELGRAMVAPAGIATIVGPGREDELKRAIVDGLAPFRTADGGYRLRNEYRYLIARA
jgi:SAM-dependent methyltransferase